MKYRVDIYGLSQADVLEQFFSSVKNSMLFYSMSYSRLLSSFLNVEYQCVVAMNEEGHVVGALPFFIKHSSKGSVANSLPFYGSHGGVVLNTADENVFSLILNFYKNYLQQQRCAASTLITSPFDPLNDAYKKYLRVEPSDSRIGQVTTLPNDSNYDSIMSCIPSKTRNMVRKSERQGLVITKDKWHGYLDFLVETHQENMAEIGGLAKPEFFFQLIDDIFVYGKDYIIYTAKIDGKAVASLLLFYYGTTVEYFTPVIKAEYRSFQPLTLLIFNAMREAAGNGYSFWNWGGTWATQEGVYRFKKSWGAVDIPYSYYTSVYDDSLLDCERSYLLSEFPYFYTVPFDWLKK